MFDDFHDVAQVLTEHLREETGILDIQPGQPRDVGGTTAPAVRLTLLYSTPQPGHRNDPLEQTAGGLGPPPLSLSCFYLVTTSGTDADDPVGAHHALGQVMGLFHDVPTLQLPLSANPGSPAPRLVKTPGGEPGLADSGSCRVGTSWKSPITCPRAWCAPTGSSASVPDVVTR